MKHKYWIDSQKVATAPVVLLMIAGYGAWDNLVAWVYLGMHGTYGLLWMLKSRTFPDSSWERPVSFAYGMTTWIGLSLYWIAPWLITSQGVHAPPWLLGLSVFVYGFGVLLHFAADMQKHTSLALRPGHLITTGLFARTRNPNYLGELLIYLSFAALAMHWAPLAVVALFLVVVWIPNMRRKDRSLTRYPAFAAYKNRTFMLIPKLKWKREAVPGQTHRIGSNKCSSGSPRNRRQQGGMAPPPAGPR